MKLGITKDGLPAVAMVFCTLISGAGIGMFLAVAFVPKDDRGVFYFSYYVTAWILILGGSFLRSMIVFAGGKKAEKDLLDEKHVA